MDNWNLHVKIRISKCANIAKFRKPLKIKKSCAAGLDAALTCGERGYTSALEVAEEVLHTHLLRAQSGKLDRARSQLYRGQILRVNMRLKALAEIYTMHTFAQLNKHIFF